MSDESFNLTIEGDAFMPFVAENYAVYSDMSNTLYNTLQERLNMTGSLIDA